MVFRLGHALHRLLGRLLEALLLIALAPIALRLRCCARRARRGPQVLVVEDGLLEFGDVEHGITSSVGLDVELIQHIVVLLAFDHIGSFLLTGALLTCNEARLSFARWLRQLPIRLFLLHFVAFAVPAVQSPVLELLADEEAGDWHVLLETWQLTLDVIVEIYRLLCGRQGSLLDFLSACQVGLLFTLIGNLLAWRGIANVNVDRWWHPAFVRLFLIVAHFALR